MSQGRNHRRRDYDSESLYKEREYGVFWYHWLWQALRPVLLVIAVLALVAGIVGAGYGYISQKYLLPVNEQDDTEVLFVVQSGNSLTRVANNLEEQGLIRNRTVFKYYADFMGFGQKIQAGEYVLKPSMTMNEIANQLSTGDGKPITRTITIIPGWTVESIAAYLVSEGALSQAEPFLSMCRAGTAFSAYYYIADVLSGGSAASRRYALEGYLSPDTYELYTTATEEDILKKLLSQVERVYVEAYHERASELGMTMDQIITLASIIEKEAKEGDFSRVSAVFHGRLKRGMTLGSDVTVKYASGVQRMSLTSEDLSYPSPYNTYLHSGLPVGPICSPSPAAIRAALYPNEDYLSAGYLYFCSKDPNTGELHFSRTLEEHNAAVSIYAPLWQAYDAQQGQ